MEDRWFAAHSERHRFLQVCAKDQELPQHNIGACDVKDNCHSSDIMGLQFSIKARWTREATRHEKLEEWRRAHPRERMRVVITSEYIIPLKHYFRDPYVCELDFDIQEIDTLHVREAILHYMG
ncbi:hypothetical protein COCNU_scaffold068333G000010 [Cocos nucifera]|nr:hypothetical protein [Cocos nucifera]